MRWAAWKLVSNDAKRTVAPPKAKHSTLPQGCFFMFLFLIPFTIQQQCIIYSQKFPNEPLLGVWGGKDFMDWAIFWICWGVVPQQPPTMLSRPSFAIALMWLAMKSGVSWYSPMALGSPALG